MKKSEDISELAKSLCLFQKEVKQPGKNAKNPFFKSNYTTIDDLVKAITDTAGKYGLSFIQTPLSEGDRVGVYTLLLHESGQWIESQPVYAVPAKKDAQGAGAVITYLRRYSLSSVMGIVSESDDDGNSAIHNQEKPNQSEDLAKVLVDTSLRTGIKQVDLYKEVSAALNINKPTKDLTEQEKKAIIAVLLKK